MVGMWRSQPILSWSLAVSYGAQLQLHPFKDPLFSGPSVNSGKKKDRGKERQVLPRQLTGSKLIVSLMSARNL